jgi:thioredoxin 1
MHQVSGVEELDEFIVENIKNKMIVVLYFGATWCGPCRQLKDKMNEPETEIIMPNLAMVYLDVDDEENADLLKRYKVNGLPTQIFVNVVKNTVNEVARIVGFDFNKLILQYNDILDNMK